MSKTKWGTDGDIPVPGDYDGNGKADMAVWRPSNATWYVYGKSAVKWGATVTSGAGRLRRQRDHGDGCLAPLDGRMADLRRHALHARRKRRPARTRRLQRQRQARSGCLAPLDRRMDRRDTFPAPSGASRPTSLSPATTTATANPTSPSGAPRTEPGTCSAHPPSPGASQTIGRSTRTQRHSPTTLLLLLLLLRRRRHRRVTHRRRPHRRVADDRLDVELDHALVGRVLDNVGVTGYGRYRTTTSSRAQRAPPTPSPGWSAEPLVLTLRRRLRRRGQPLRQGNDQRLDHHPAHHPHHPRRPRPVTRNRLRHLRDSRRAQRPECRSRRHGIRRRTTWACRATAAT